MVTPERIASLVQPFRCDVGNILYDTVDSPEMHEAVANYSWPHFLTVIRASYDGISHITIATRKIASWGEATGRYEVTPSVVLPAVITAALAVYAAQEIRNEKIDWPIASIFTASGIREFKIGGMTNGVGK
jgi:hypothetical protein